MVLKRNTEQKKKHTTHHSTGNAVHYATPTQQADREHYSLPYVTRRPGFLKSLPVYFVRISDKNSDFFPGQF